MRKLAIVLVILLALIGVAAYSIARFDSFLDDNRERFAERASVALGRSVNFSGLDWSLRGGLAARLSEVVIGDDSAFSDDAFLTVSRADVRVKILPALRGRYEIDRIMLVAPVLTVIRERNRFNFDSIGERRRQRPPPTAAAPEPSRTDSSRALSLFVALTRVRDGRLRYVDRTLSPVAEMVIKDLDFSASEVGFDSIMRIEFSATVVESSHPNLRVVGTVGPIAAADRWMDAPLHLAVDLGPVSIDSLKLLPVVGPALPRQLSSPDPVSATAEVRGRLGAPEVSFAFDATEAAFRYGDAFEKAVGMRLALRADIATTRERIEISDLMLQLGESSLHASGTVATAASRRIDLSVRGTDLPLSGWGGITVAAEAIELAGTMDVEVRVAGAAASGFPSLQGVVRLRDGRAIHPRTGIEISGVTTAIALQGDRIEIPPTRFAVAGQPVRMSATVTSLKKRMAEFAVSSPELRLSAFGAAEPGLKRAEVLHGVDVDGTVVWRDDAPRMGAKVRSTTGTVRDVEYANFTAEISVAQRRTSLRNASVDAFAGSVTGAGTYDVGDARKPEFSFRGRVRGLDVASLVDQLGVAAALPMTGQLSGDLQIAGAGSERDEIARQLSGGGSLAVRNGVLRDVNLAERALSAITGVPGLSGLLAPQVRVKHRQLFSDPDTAFEFLGAEVTVAGGRANLRQAILRARHYSLRGDGTVDFDNSVDMAASFVASADLTRDLLDSVREAKYLVDTDGRFRIPLRLTGSLPRIRVQPDSRTVSKLLSEALVASGIGQGLDAIFGRKDDSSDEGGSEVPPGEHPPTPEDTIENLLRKGLDRLFGGERRNE